MAELCVKEAMNNWMQIESAVVLFITKEFVPSHRYTNRRPKAKSVLDTVESI